MPQPTPATGKYPFVGIVLATAGGILLADFWPLSIKLSTLIFGLAILLWAFTRKTLTLLLAVAAVFFLIHGRQFEANPGRLLAERPGNTGITLTGTGVVDSVPSEMLSSTGKIRSQFQIAQTMLTTEGGSRLGPLHLLVSWPNANPQIGDTIRFEGNLQNLEKPRNPGEFDYANWLGRQQIFSRLSVPNLKNAVITRAGSPWNVRRWANHSKLWLNEIITRDLTNAPNEAGVISAMMLGAKSETPDATLELFMRTGTFHLFSVSGLHVTMLAGITLFILLLLRVPRRFALLLSIPILFGYALITGWSPSSVRAATMTTAFIVATLLHRPSLSLNTLAVAGFLILAFNTNELFAAGFQLSFSVVAAIILLNQPLNRLVKLLTDPDPFIPRKLLTPFQKSRWLLAHQAGGNIALTVSAWLGSLPLTAVYFNLLSPVALVANLLVIPLSFFILTLGVLSVLSSFIGNWLVVAFNNASWGLVKILLAMLSFFSWLPGSSLFVGPHWWQHPKQERLTVFDLGSGGAAVIETSGHCWLIDCGSDASYRQIVRLYLQQRGINRVDGILLTHGDGGHIGGIGQFQIDFPKAAIYLPEAGRKSLAFRRLLGASPVRWIAQGSDLTVNSETRIEILWPSEKVDSGRADDHSLVLKLTMADQRFLFMGDSGFLTESELLAQPSPRDLAADWLILGRNRNDPGGSQEFLQMVGAKTILQTADNFPSSEKVPASLIDSCQKLDIRLLRFDETGAVQIDLQNHDLHLKTFAQPHQTKRLR